MNKVSNDYIQIKYTVGGLKGKLILIKGALILEKNVAFYASWGCEADKEQGGEMGKGSTETLRPWLHWKNYHCVKIRKVRQGMLSLGLVSSIPALGGSRDLKFETCSAQNLMHWFCLYFKLFLLLGPSLHLGEEQRLFSVFRSSKMLFRSVGKRNLLFACLESVEENI